MKGDIPSIDYRDTSTTSGIMSYPYADIYPTINVSVELPAYLLFCFICSIFLNCFVICKLVWRKNKEDA